MKQMLQSLLVLLTVLTMCISAAVAEEITTPTDLTEPPASEATPPAEPTASPEPSDTPEATDAPTPTAKPTVRPTARPTAAPTPAETAAPTPETAQPEAMPTAAPEADAEPGEEPADEPDNAPEAIETEPADEEPAEGEEQAEAEDEETASRIPLYGCVNYKTTRVMSEPSYQSEMLADVDRTGMRLIVYEYGTTWCLCEYQGLIGYVPTGALYEFSRMGSEPIPGYHTCTGVVMLKGTVTITSGQFESNVLPMGTLLAVEDESGVLPVYRESGQVPAGTFFYAPFIPVDEAQPGDLLYAFTTFYNQMSGGKMAAQRRANIELAAQRMAATVEPGASLSFNRYCGPYSDRTGYVNAPNLSVTDLEMGGGVNQVATTLYNALLGLPLQIDEWHVNDVSGVAYVPVNLDAMVSRTSDLVFTNTLPYAIEVRVQPQNGALTALIYRATNE